jgi:hypothetical protein
MDNFKDIIGNRTRDCSACSAVPQPTAPLRAPSNSGNLLYDGIQYTHVIIFLYDAHDPGVVNSRRRKIKTTAFRVC